MASNKFQYGELNPNIVARSGHELDPARFSAYHVQQKVIEDYLLPKGFKTIQGPLRGIVLRDETPSAQNAFGEYRGANNTVKKPLVRIKVRIPELHPFPDPLIYGREGDDSIISLYPTFVAVSEDLSTPADGEIVYVDYGDRENLEDPRYYGRIFNTPIFGGTNQTTDKIEPKVDLFDKALGSLKDFLAPPTSKTDEPTTIVPNETPKIECKEGTDPNQLFQPDLSSCTKDDTIGGEYDLYSDGQKIGTANMVVWTNKNGSKKLVKENVLHTLEKMREDMKAQIGADLQINSGFRPFTTQQCMYEKYAKCKEEWTKNGKKGLPPSAVSNPAKSGPSSHMTGKATDFQTGVGYASLAEAKKTKSKAEIISEAQNGNFTKTWQWLITNSQKYGWIWTGFSINEPWHFEWNSSIAIINGIISKE